MVELNTYNYKMILAAATNMEFIREHGLQFQIKKGEHPTDKISLGTRIIGTDPLEFEPPVRFLVIRIGYDNAEYRFIDDDNGEEKFKNKIKYILLTKLKED